MIYISAKINNILYCSYVSKQGALSGHPGALDMNIVIVNPIRIFLLTNPQTQTHMNSVCPTALRKTKPKVPHTVYGLVIIRSVRRLCVKVKAKGPTAFALPPVEKEQRRTGHVSSLISRAACIIQYSSFCLFKAFFRAGIVLGFVAGVCTVARAIEIECFRFWR